MAYTTATQAPQTFFTARFGAAVESVVAHYKLRKLYRETYRSLSALDDRELEDLGLSRAGLQRISWDSARSALR